MNMTVFVPKNRTFLPNEMNIKKGDKFKVTAEYMTYKRNFRNQPSYHKESRLKVKP
jgi:hypothetical protein